MHLKKSTLWKYVIKPLSTIFLICPGSVLYIHCIQAITFDKSQTEVKEY